MYFTLDDYHLGRIPSDADGAVISHICKSVMNATGLVSKIEPGTPNGDYILGYDGMTGTRTRHFYNNICSCPSFDVRYLEIGTWNGSSSMSAVYHNKMKALFIDNWSQFNGDSKIFNANMQKVTDSNVDYSFIESDCWKVDLGKIDTKFNIYLYDGDHSELDHCMALKYYLPVLQDSFIFMVDDWNWPNVRDGTMRAFAETGCQVLFRHEEFVGSDDTRGMPNHAGKRGWWNGIGIFYVKKPIQVTIPMGFLNRN